METSIVYLLVAEKVLLEEGTGKPSLIGLFNEVTIPKGLDFVAMPVTVFARIKDVSGKIDAKISIVDPDDHELESVKVAGDLKTKSTVNLRGIFTLLTFTKNGEYKIRVSINNKELPSRDDHMFTVKKA